MIILQVNNLELVIKKQAIIQQIKIKIIKHKKTILKIIKLYQIIKQVLKIVTLIVI